MTDRKAKDSQRSKFELAAREAMVIHQEEQIWEQRQQESRTT